MSIVKQISVKLSMCIYTKLWVQSDLKCETTWVFKWQRSVCKVRDVTPQFADPQVLRKLEPGIGPELFPPNLLNNQMLLNNCVYKKTR